MSNKIKVGICIWCVPEKGPLAVKLAHDMGYEGIVLDLGKIEEGFPISKPEVQKEYIEISKEYNMEFSTLAVNQLCITGMNKAENYEKIKEIMNIVVDTACALNIKLLQIPSFGDGFIKTEEDFVNTSKCLKYVCQISKDKGLTVGTENGMTAEANLRMLEMVNEENLKIYYDTANPFWLAGGMDGPSILSKIREYVCEVHLKDVGYKDESKKLGFVPLGSGVVGVNESIGILKNTNYAGWVHNENSYTFELLKQDAVFIKNIFNL